jgi:antitoxin (DNA-binding transcriptional repressor) of toxin-antitoxin stability system
MVTNTYGVREAKENFSRLLNLCARGHNVRIHRRGEIFKLVAVKPLEIAPATAAELRACYDDPAENALVNRFGQESDR